MGYWENKLKTYKDLKKVAGEAIRYQDRTKLESLAVAVGKFRAAGGFDAIDYKNSIITKTVFDLFNVTIELDNGASFGVTDMVYAGVMPPSFDPNNAIVDQVRRMFIQAETRFEDFTRVFKKNEVSGYVDFKNARLGEDFSKISCMLVASRALMTHDDFTDMEIAAIIAHEIGHIFSYFEATVQTCYYNMLARATADEILNTKDDKLRARVVKSFLGLTGVEQVNMETALESKNRDVVYLHLYNSILLQRPNLSGSSSIAERNWERAADEFVGRLGGSQHLVSGLIKIHKLTPAIFRENGVLSMPLHFAIEISKIAFVIGMAAMGPGGVLLSVLTTMSAFIRPDIYDPIEERLVTMRNHLKGELRGLEDGKGAGADALRKRILGDIETVDNLLSEIKDKTSVADILNYLLSSNYRRNVKYTEHQKQIEQYLNNDLIIAANRLKIRN